VLETKQARSASLNWDKLDYLTFNLTEMEAEITEEEIKSFIVRMPKENAPGPDGFIGAFYHKCWGIVKGEVTAVVHQFS
jgi:hypothetical protein